MAISINNKTSFTPPKVVRKLSSEILRQRPQECFRKEQLEKESYSQWTIRMMGKRPFIKTQYEILVKKLFSEFKVSERVKPARKQKKVLRHQATILIGKKYRYAKF